MDHRHIAVTHTRTDDRVIQLSHPVKKDLVSRRASPDTRIIAKTFMLSSRKSPQHSSAAQTREEALAMVNLPLKSTVQKIWKLPSRVWLPLGKASSYGLLWNWQDIVGLSKEEHRILAKMGRQNASNIHSLGLFYSSYGVILKNKPVPQ